MKNVGEYGFSIVGALVALAIVSIIALGISALSTQMNLISRDMQSKSGRAALTSILEGILTTKSMCDSQLSIDGTLQIPTANSVGTSNLSINLNDDNPPSVVKQNATLEKFALTVPPSGFQFRIPEGSLPVMSGSDELWTGTIDLSVYKQSQSIGGMSMQRRSLGVFTVRVNAARSFVACERFTFSGEAVCENLGGSWTGAICNFPYQPPCPNGSILIGSNAATGCKSCPAGNTFVFNGSGGVSCQPYP